MSREQQLFDALEGALTLIDMSRAPDWVAIATSTAMAGGRPADPVPLAFISVRNKDLLLDPRRHYCTVLSFADIGNTDDDATIPLFMHASSFAPNKFANEESFKNFHRNLCQRFGYTHDDKFWWRDLSSLIEHIAALPLSGGVQGDAAREAWRFNGDRASASAITTWANSFPELDEGEPNASYITTDGSDVVTDLMLAVDDEDMPVQVGDYVAREGSKFCILRAAIASQQDGGRGG